MSELGFKVCDGCGSWNAFIEGWNGNWFCIHCMISADLPVEIKMG